MLRSITRLARARAAALAVAGGLLAGCGGGGGKPEPVGPVTPTPLPTVTTGGKTERPDPGAIKGETGPDLTAAAERGARAYIRALSSHDGRVICAVLAPGALDGVRLPEPRENCPEALDASIGHVDRKGGYPEWTRTKLLGMRTVLQGDERARITATVHHDFVGRPEISTEEDVIYLQRDGDRWLLAKPSTTFYRAIGVPDVPPSVLAPPD
jgi:hypothetical protein